jgi:nucleoid DNA-binding protein
MLAEYIEAEYIEKELFIEALAKGEAVQMLGFWTFETHVRTAREGSNP